MAGPDPTLRQLSLKLGELANCRRAKAHVRARMQGHVNQAGFLRALRTQEVALVREIMALELALSLGVYDHESHPS